MRWNAISNGFTLLEMMLTLALVGVFTLGGVMAFRANQKVWKQTASRHVLEAEEGDVVDLLGGLLRRADPSTVAIQSSSEGPWSRLQFVASGHQYAFYGERGTLWFRVDDLQPKSLSSHLFGIQFATGRSHLPTLLTWSVCLGIPGTNSPASRVVFSATQFLEQPPE